MYRDLHKWAKGVAKASTGSCVHTGEDLFERSWLLFYVRNQEAYQIPSGVTTIGLEGKYA